MIVHPTEQQIANMKQGMERYDQGAPGYKSFCVMEQGWICQRCKAFNGIANVACVNCSEQKD